MPYTVSGKVYEKESDRPLAGLRIRAFDKDLLFDDVLGSTITDDKGQFQIEYREEDFRELFEHKPDIYIAVYSATGRHITNTKKKVRWGASDNEYFDVAIERRSIELLRPEAASENKKKLTDVL